MTITFDVRNDRALFVLMVICLVAFCAVSAIKAPHAPTEPVGGWEETEQ